MWWMIDGASAADAGEVETDPAMVVSIGAVTYLSAAVFHEGLGHELGCVIGGGRPTGFSLAVAGCEETTPGQHRWTSAGGALGNLAAGSAFGATLALGHPRDGVVVDYLWLNTVTNLWQAGGYLMVGPWLPVGDWGSDGFLRDIDHPLPLQLGLSLGGAAMTFATIPLAQHLGKPLFGADGTRSARGRWLTLLPYAGGSTLVVTGSLLNRAGPEFAVSAAVSTFAGTLFLAYLPLFFSDDVWVPGQPYTGAPSPIERKPGWLVVSGVVALGAVTVLGPGVGAGFDRPHPLDPRRW
ncbi:MAG: hypothetical protein ABMA64_16155 [Myxococcota bacterium]